MTGSPATRQTPDALTGPRAALLIATSTYQDPHFAKMQAPAHDVADLASALQDPSIGGFDVTTVVDAKERKIRRSIGEFLRDRAREETVLVYLSCHGALDERNQLYYAGRDTRMALLRATGIDAEWLNRELAECHARTKILILDCCHSGAYKSGRKSGGDDLGLVRRFGRGTAVMTASRASEFSFTDGSIETVDGTKPRGSVFTTGLIEGLRTGDADPSGTGYITLEGAYSYVEDYVRRVGTAQTPQRSLEGGEGEIILARNPAGKLVEAAPIPQDLLDQLESRYSHVRVGAIKALGDWLLAGDPPRALAAAQELHRVIDSDNPIVAGEARALLGLEESRAPGDTGTTGSDNEQRAPGDPANAPRPVDESSATSSRSVMPKQEKPEAPVTRGKFDRGRFEWTPEARAMRRAMATHLWSRDNIETCTQASGLDLKRLPYRAAPDDAWFEAIETASAHISPGVLDALVDEAASRHPAVAEAVQRWRESRE